jgi:MYXO-CTERM domain-containing protein
MHGLDRRHARSGAMRFSSLAVLTVSACFAVPSMALAQGFRDGDPREIWKRAEPYLRAIQPPPAGAPSRRAGAPPAQPGNIQPILSTFCTSEDPMTGASPPGCTAFVDANCVGTGVPPVYQLSPGGTAINAAKDFYAVQPDRFDTILFWRDYLQDICTASAYYFPVFSNVQGIGRAHMGLPQDLRPYYGVGPTGQLRGFVDMGQLYDCALSSQIGLDCPGTSFPMDAASLLGILGQESGHQWGAFVYYRKASGGDSSDLLGRSYQHWSWFADTGGGTPSSDLGSPMEGNHWIIGAPSDPRPFKISMGTRTAYSPLDQYLMGIRPDTEVPPFFYIVQPDGGAYPNQVASSPPYTPPVAQYEPTEIGGQSVSVDIGQIEAAEGTRLPAFGDAPFFTRQAWVFLIHPGGTAAAAQPILDQLETLRQAWTSYFYDATDRRMRAITTLSGRDDLPLFTFHVSTEGWTVFGARGSAIDHQNGGLLVGCEQNCILQNQNVALPTAKATAIVFGATYPAAPSGDLVLGFTTTSSFSPTDEVHSVNPVDGRTYHHRIIYLTAAKGAPPQAAMDWTGEILGLELQLMAGVPSVPHDPALIDHFEFTLSPPPDADGDGIADDEDNCPAIANPDQADVNQNGVGDACEPGAGTDGGLADGGGADGGTPTEPPKTGCGCSASPGLEPLGIAAFIGLAALRRRRRKPRSS